MPLGGFYTPSDGDVWSAANFITYVRNQTVNQFASAAARTTAVGTPAGPMMSYLDDTKRLDFWDGSAWQLVAFIPNYVFARRTSDASSIASSTTLVDDTQLQLAVGTNAVYMVTSHIIYSADASGDLQVGWSGPASATFNWNLNGPASTSSGGAVSIYAGQNSIGGTDIAGGVGAATSIVAHPTGLLITAGTAGTFKFRWAQGTSNVNGTQVRADSHLMAVRVA